MAENKDYNGSIKIYGSMVPAGSFPLVQAKDVFVDSQTRLDEKLESFGSANTPKFELMNDNELWVSYDNGITWGILGKLPQGEKGDKGDPGNITINGKGKLRFYVGKTEEEFNNEVEDKTNVFAIIDDPKEGSLIGKIQGFIDGSIPVPVAKNSENAENAVNAENATNDGNFENISQTYVRKDEQKIFMYGGSTGTISADKVYQIGKLPEGKTLDDIVGIGISVFVSEQKVVGSDYTVGSNLPLVGVKTTSISLDRLRFKFSAVNYDFVNSIGVSKIFGVSSAEAFLTTDGEYINLSFENINYTALHNYVEGIKFVSYDLSYKSSTTIGEFVLNELYYWFA